jgi:hypothetical protein
MLKGGLGFVGVVIVGHVLLNWSPQHLVAFARRACRL